MCGRMEEGYVKHIPSISGIPDGWKGGAAMQGFTSLLACATDFAVEVANQVGDNH